MKFDSNRAWLDAMAAVRASRQVLLPIAGVFFLLPTLLSAVFLTDAQTQIVSAMHKPQIMERLLTDNMGRILGFGIGGMLVQGIGYLALMALLSDRARPTVGEAIMVALRALPTLIGTGLLAMLGMFLAAMALGIVIGGLLGLVAGTGVASVIVGVAMMVLMAYVSVKFSLVVPVVVNERIGNPIAALVRSWKLTRHNSLRLFGFFLLLMIAYIAIALTLTMALVAPATLLLGDGRALTLYAGVVSGAIGAVSSVILAAILAYTHRQLAGPSNVEISRTFE